MQQVNLYLEEFKRTEPPFSAVIIVILCGYVLVIGTFISIGMALYVSAEKNAATESQNQAIEWSEQLSIAEQQYPAPVVSENLKKKLQTLKRDIQRNNLVLSYLKNRQQEAENQAFSVLLLALTWVKQDGLWLTHVKIQDGGRALQLKGRALTSEALPLYIDKLREVEVFADMTFRVFDMHRGDEGLEFEIASYHQEQKVETVLENLTKGR